MQSRWGYATCRPHFAHPGQAYAGKSPGLQRGFASGDSGCDAKNSLIRILSDVVSNDFANRSTL
jgi:hypothetical protein